MITAEAMLFEMELWSKTNRGTLSFTIHGIMYSVVMLVYHDHKFENGIVFAQENVSGVLSYIWFSQRPKHAQRWRLHLHINFGMQISDGHSYDGWYNTEQNYFERNQMHFV